MLRSKRRWKSFGIAFSKRGSDESTRRVRLSEEKTRAPAVCTSGWENGLARACVGACFELFITYICYKSSKRSRDPSFSRRFRESSPLARATGVKTRDIEYIKATTTAFGTVTRIIFNAGRYVKFKTRELCHTTEKLKPSPTQKLLAKFFNSSQFEDGDPRALGSSANLQH